MVKKAAPIEPFLCDLLGHQGHAYLLAFVWIRDLAVNIEATGLPCRCQRHNGKVAENARQPCQRRHRLCANTKRPGWPASFA